MALLELTNADNGKTVESLSGDEIVLRLPENPTTGHRWHMDHIDPTLEQAGDSYRPDPDMRFGSGGTREFRFRTKAPGTARLELKNYQPWTGESSVIARFSVNIHCAA